MPGEAIGVIDIGKTHARLLVVEGDTGALLWSQQHECQPRSGPIMRELDIHGLETWLVTALRNAPDKARLRTLVPVAHGAAAVLLDAQGNALLAPDYEDPTFESTAESYRPLRDPFDATFSPFLPLGLNLGRQLHYVQTLHPRVWNTVATVLLYPQYWAWRFSGVAASELTSLGCHTDLWRPVERRYSEVAVQQGWAALLPPLKSPQESLGAISPLLARATGLDPGCRVLCGIHDSNASWLCHLAARDSDRAFAVISSGTWTVIMAHGTPLTALTERDDMLANVDAHGNLTATARFMGGREYQVIAGKHGMHSTPGMAEAGIVMDRGAMALPCFAAAGGPFAHKQGHIIDGENLRPAELAALATLYITLMTDLLLDKLAFTGDVIVDGPLAMNGLYSSLLAGLRRGDRILISDRIAGAATAARHLAGYTIGSSNGKPVQPAFADRLSTYRNRWRNQLAVTYSYSAQGP